MTIFIWNFFKSILTNPLVLGILIIYVILVIFYKRFIGFFGELWVKQELNKLNKKNYFIINNVMIKTRDEKTHQIDHLVISKYGIFVIETKQYNGYIIGNNYDKKWSVKSGRNVYMVNNPLHQNYGHIKALEEVLTLDNKFFYNIVCIRSRATVRVKSDNVVRIYELLNKIQMFKKEIINNPADLYNNIKLLNITSNKERKKHIKYAKKLKRSKEITDINKCPKCGCNLILRNGKFGEFYGCSNFPRCRYIKNK